MRVKSKVHLGSRLSLFATLLFALSLVTGSCGQAPGSNHLLEQPTTLPIVTPTPTINAQQQQFQLQLQAKLEAKSREAHFQGAAIFVDSNRTGSWTTSLGSNDIEGQEPIKPDMHFRIGSITKTFVGTVILQLVSEGKLGLDDAVTKYLPQVPNGANISLRELLAMTSGLYNYTDDADFEQDLITHPDKIWTPQDLLAISFKHAPLFAPGQGYAYANTNFILLGMIIEQVTSHPLESEVQQRIFKPLGMNNTLLPTRTDATLPVPFARGYEVNTDGTLQDVTTWSPSWAWAAGSAISTTHDLGIWAKVLASGQLLSPAMQKERLTWGTTNSTSLQYGLAVIDSAGFIGHSGKVPGYQSDEWYRLDTQTTIVVLANLDTTSDGSEPADTLLNVIKADLAS